MLSHVAVAVVMAAAVTVVADEAAADVMAVVVAAWDAAGIMQARVMLVELAGIVRAHAMQQALVPVIVALVAVADGAEVVGTVDGAGDMAAGYGAQLQLS